MGSSGDLYPIKAYFKTLFSSSADEKSSSFQSQLYYRDTLGSSTKLRGWSGGAKVLGKLSVPGRPTSLDDSRARAYCACSRCGWGFVWTFFLSSITSLFFLPLFGRRPDID